MTHGLNPRGAHNLLLSVGLPLLWLMISLPNPVHCGRLVLALVASLQPLIAFPVSGSQVAFGSAPLLICMLVLLTDGWGILCQTAFGGHASGMSRPQGKWIPAIIFIGLLACVLVRRDVCGYRYRSARVPLGLTGAESLRLDPEFVAKQRWLVHQLRQNADTFLFSQHTRNSVYFWASMDPPNAVNATFWPFMLSSAEQSSIVQSLDGYDRVAIVNEPHYDSVPSGPLVRRIAEGPKRNEIVATKDKTQVWIVDRTYCAGS